MKIPVVKIVVLVALLGGVYFFVNQNSVIPQPSMPAPTAKTDVLNEENILLYFQNTTGFGYGIERISEIRKIEDINKDGQDDFLIRAGGAGGTCVGGTSYTILYSPKNQEYFIAAESGLEIMPIEYEKVAFCTTPKQFFWEGCGERLEYTCFSNNLKQGKNNEFKTYLENAMQKKSSLTSVPSLPTTCIDAQDGMPVITSLSSYSGPVGVEIEIRGCNFSGFEGDKNAWIENDKGVKGIIYGKKGSTAKILKIILESPLCQNDTSYNGLSCDKWLILNPGTYKIYTMPWGKKSNEATFTLK